MSYCRLFYHIVFRTKDSVYAINEENEKILYDYIWDLLNHTILYFIELMVCQIIYIYLLNYTKRFQ